MKEASMRNIVVAFVIALTPPLAFAQEYPVIRELEGIDLTEYFVNGGSPVGNIDVERNCRPSGADKDVLFWPEQPGWWHENGYEHRFGGTGTFLLFNRRGIEDADRRERAEDQALVLNRYFSCLGLGRLRDPGEFGCTSLKILLQFLEMFQPNHPSPDRVHWSDMDQELYLQLYRIGRRIQRARDGASDGLYANLFRKSYGGNWSLCAELWW